MDAKMVSVTTKSPMFRDPLLSFVFCMGVRSKAVQHFGVESRESEEAKFLMDFAFGKLDGSEKKQLKKFLESLGGKFGSDLN